MSRRQPVNHRLPRVFAVVAILLLIVAAACFAATVVPFATIRGRLDDLSGDGSADPYTPQLHRRLQFGAFLAGVSLITAFAATYRFRKGLSQIYARLHSDTAKLCRWLGSLGHCAGGTIIVLTIVAVAARVPYLNQPMRFDEAYTYNNYVSQPWFVALSKYDAPNNHILHSIMAQLATRLVGDAPWAVRLPAFLAGVLLVPATILLAVAADGRRAAWFAGGLVAVSSPLVEYSTNARGYTLVCLFAVCGWLLLAQAARQCNLAAWCGWSLVTAMGCWTIPVMVYPLSMQIFWLASQHHIKRTRLAYRGAYLRWFALAGLGAAAVTVVCYLPVLLVSGPKGLLASSQVNPLSWRAFIKGVDDWLIELAGLLARDLTWSAAILLLVGFGIALSSGSPRTRFARWCAAASLLAPALLIAAQRVLPFARVWLFLLPLVAVMVGAGLSRLVELVPSGVWRRVMAIVVLLVVVVLPWIATVHHDVIRQSLETGTLPEAAQLVEDLKSTLAPGEPVVAVAPCSAPLIYYARRAGLPRNHFDRPGPTASRGVIVVSRRPSQTIEQILEQLELDEFRHYQFELLQDYPSARTFRWTPAVP